MKIISVTDLAIPDVKVIRFQRFTDHRGYFTETFRRSDFKALECLKEYEILQANESRSVANVMRGMHFQWNPHMGKLVRTISGRMVDMVLDIRLNSPTFGKMIAYDMPAPQEGYDEYIWVPPGFAHGNYFTEESKIEYLCTGEYSQGCEAGISPLAADIDFSLMDAALKKEFDEMKAKAIMTDKDRDGFTLAAWKENENSKEFVYK